MRDFLLSYPMVGWAGAPQGAPVANKAGKTNSVQSATNKIGLLGGGYSTFVGGCHYGYYPHANTPVTCCSPQCRHGFHGTGRTLRNLRKHPD
ncbi:hypothetical protein [[Enterobacter] lignolyticus]|uniref:hypothetical protein n=1 Tax=[Enterobacter] lignolyticus TaxID=1334193 RepID=UPI002FFAFF1C